MINQRILYQPVPIENNQNEINIRNRKLDPRQGQTQRFEDILRQRLEQDQQLKFSSHATNRLEQRNIHLNESDKSRLQNAVEKVAAKGSRESLIMMDNVSYIVNIPNRTVITALDQDSAKDNVFTNIDSAMIAK